MCDTCGCGEPRQVAVHPEISLLDENAARARHNRAHFAAAGVTVVNVMGGPGSGKTALLEATRAVLGPEVGLAALSGDLATERDAERLRAAGIPAWSITTGAACHLDAAMVHRALHHLAWEGAAYLFIENVGNLVCPAVYDLGQTANVVCLSVTEGADKPLKYPIMFRAADLVVVTKTDLLPAVDFSLPAFAEALARTVPEPRWLALSVRTGEGLDAWGRWLAAARPAAHAEAAP